jgi:hypothetical protein
LLFLVSQDDRNEQVPLLLPPPLPPLPLLPSVC